MGRKVIAPMCLHRPQLLPSPGTAWSTEQCHRSTQHAGPRIALAHHSHGFWSLASWERNDQAYPTPERRKGKPLPESTGPPPSLNQNWSTRVQVAAPVHCWCERDRTAATPTPTGYPPPCRLPCESDEWNRKQRWTEQLL